MALRLATYRGTGSTTEAPRVAVSADGQAFDLARGHRVFVADGEGRPERIATQSVVAFLEAGAPAVAEAKACLEFLEQQPEDKLSDIVLDLSKVELLPPIPEPKKIFCLAGNYREHIQESTSKNLAGDITKSDVATPRIFMKPPSTTLIGHRQAVKIPRIGQFVDYEAELAVVMGKRGKYISRDEALDYVGGYTIFDDISERELKVWERPEDRQWDKFFDWLNGKWGDGFAPMGPWLVPASEVPEVQALGIKLWLNGELKQDSSTERMIFAVAQIVEYASSLCTLEPGDIIATGTPSGVGHAQGLKLKPGDEIRIEIEGLGTLVNPVEAE